MRHLERQIDELTYPAKLATPVKRILAAKYEEVNRDFNEQQAVVLSEKQKIGRTVVDDLKDLPKALQSLAKKHAKLVAATKQIAETLAAQGVNIAYGGGFIVKAKEAEVTARILAADAKLKALSENRDKALADLQGLAKKLAAAEVKVVKAKIAKANPQLVEELDSIGQQLLPPAEEPKPVKALKGKTQKAAANEAVHPSPRD
jgi:hypothetical protein